MPVGIFIALDYLVPVPVLNFSVLDFPRGATQLCKEFARSVEKTDLLGTRLQLSFCLAHFQDLLLNSELVIRLLNFVATDSLIVELHLSQGGRIEPLVVRNWSFDFVDGISARCHSDLSVVSSNELLLVFDHTRSSFLKFCLLRFV